MSCDYTQEMRESTVLVDPRDCVYTPWWATAAFLRWARTSLGPAAFARTLDPFAGDGAILRACEVHTCTLHGELHAWEIRAEECASLVEVADHVTIGDWLQCGSGFDGAIVTNPPYRNGQAFLAARLCQERAPIVALLLPLPFLASQSRSAWLREHMPAHALVLPKRPSFRPATIHERHDDAKGWGTTSQDYAWMVWMRTDHRSCGSIEILEV